MGWLDTPPAGTPSWLILANFALLGTGVLLWDVTYILMTRRSIETKSYGMPLMVLAINLSWEIVFVFFVIETVLEFLGFVTWLILDIGLVYTTIKYGEREWKVSNPWVGRNIAWLLALMTLVACFGQYAVCSWWLEEPGRGFGDKTGKWWGGREGIDTTELSFWLAAVAQLFGSAGSLAMLVVRGHSGGTGYAIWLSRSLGTVFGLMLSPFLLWWYWPAAHEYIYHPLAVFLCGTSVMCDIVYPFVLWNVRQTEIKLADGSLVRAGQSDVPEESRGGVAGRKKRV
ncbi:hypothetical protein GQ53DRAFT_747725 [Thozetella sp. PMI_491]|nr:hypothetical protein GQ53DRAFT_747725 [Thozetella sp. PMI_491]